MQVNRITNSLLTNKTVLKGLEKISEHGTSFAAGASLLMSLGVRTFSIYNTPDVEKENKFYAMANSITSGIVKFGIVEAIALPIENAVSRIDKDASKYLKDTTLKNFSPETRSYKFITQIIKLSTGLLTAIPKSMLTIALIPVVMNKIFHYNPLEDLKKAAEKFPYKNEASKFFNRELTRESEQPKAKEPAFTGSIGDKLSNGISKIFYDEIADYSNEEKLKDAVDNVNYIFGTQLLKYDTPANINMAKRALSSNAITLPSGKSRFLRKDTYKYYAYRQFKRGRFKRSEDFTYDSEGRITKMVFEFTGDIS